MIRTQRIKKITNRKIVLLFTYVVILGLLCLFLVSCSPPRSERSRGNGGIYISCRDYLIKGQKEKPGYGLYSYIIFSNEPTNEIEFRRYLTLYHAYRSHIRKYKEFSDYPIDKANLNILYWPLQSDPIKRGMAAYENNGHFVENYDYARAAYLRSKIKGLKGPGPFIVACHFPLSSVSFNEKHKEMLIINLSRVDEDLFTDVFLWFKAKVADDAATWKYSFDWNKLRIHFYSMLKLHGEPVLNAAKWVGEVFEIKRALGGT